MKTISKSIILALTIFTSTIFHAQEEEKDSLKTNNLNEVMVKAVRADEKTPVTFSNFTKKEIKKRNLGQDIPILMNYLPSVVTTSDAGNGVGYTGIRVRGSDASRVNVTVNGIPYNDSESHGTFWVNMPDIASSVESIQLQRGVGTSTNGAGAFGASLNLLTENTSKKAGGEISNSYGSFNTRKHTVKFNTGILNEKFELSGRLSKLNSDGYIERAKSNLKSYFLQANYIGKTTKIKALVFGGKEITYQSWYGIDKNQLLINRKFNPAGAFTDEFGNSRFYDNQVDDYQQDHFQLHWNEKLSNNWSSNLAFHYTKGKGFYENYENDKDFTEFNLTPIGNMNTTDIINQKWLDNDFYGFTYNANYNYKDWEIVIGGAANRYNGKHFGKIIWARYASTSERQDDYYNDFGNKNDVNFYAKANYQITKDLNFYGDLQYRFVSYKANGIPPREVNESFNFLNPKAGLTYSFNESNNLYFSYGRANREPKRADYENQNVKSESLNDYELGWRFENKNNKWNVNLYYMQYKNQLVLTGALNDVGTPIAENSGESYRFGLELDGSIKIAKELIINPNFAISENKNKNFHFNRDGVLQNLGNTNISYSPNIIIGNSIIIYPLKGLSTTFLSKFVGNQYMGNIDSKESILKDYFINDLNVFYEFSTKKIFQSIILNVLVNNVFDRKYISNGYFYTYDDTWSNPNAITTIEGAGYYPQAGINLLCGLTLKF